MIEEWNGAYAEVSITREKVRAAIQRLENQPVRKSRCRPWVSLSDATDQALKAKVLGRIQDRLFWIGDKRNALHSQPEIQSRNLTELHSILSAIDAAVDDPYTKERALWSLDSNLGDIYDRIAPQSRVSAEIRRQLAGSDQSTREYFEDLRDASSGYAIHATDHLEPSELLVLRKQALAQYYRHERAKATRRHQLLWLTSALLWFLVGALLVVTATLEIDSVRIPRPEIASALVLGGFGGSLSGMRRLRDELERLAQMDSFRAAVWAQLAAAAGLGLFALILFEAGALPQIGSTSAWDALVYSFLAGFSEPFAIQAVTRLAGRG